MMDQNYANAFMKTAVSSLQEHVTLLLHTKTQNIVLNEVIENLNTQNRNFAKTIEELNEELNRKNSLLSEMETLRNKASTLDTALAQISELKRIVKEKDQELLSFKAEESAKSKKKIKPKLIVEENDF